MKLKTTIFLFASAFMYLFGIHHVDAAFTVSGSQILVSGTEDLASFATWAAGNPQATAHDSNTVEANNQLKIQNGAEFDTSDGVLIINHRLEGQSNNSLDSGVWRCHGGSVIVQGTQNQYAEYWAPMDFDRCHWIINKSGGQQAYFRSEASAVATQVKNSTFIQNSGGIDGHLQFSAGTGTVVDTWFENKGGGTPFLLIRDSDSDGIGLIGIDLGGWNSLSQPTTFHKNMTFDHGTGSDANKIIYYYRRNNFPIFYNATNNTTGERMDTLSYRNPGTGGGSGRGIIVGKFEPVFQNENGVAIDSAHIEIKRNSDDVVVYDVSTDATGKVDTSTTPSLSYNGRDITETGILYVPQSITTGTGVEDSVDQGDFRIRVRKKELRFFESTQAFTSDFDGVKILTSDPNYTATITDYLALTDISNSQDLYDYTKYYLEDNIHVNELGTRQGDVFSTSHNITIDKTALNVFEFDGSTITIKSDEFLGEITTTGLVTFLNGAIQGEDYTDSTGFNSVDSIDPSIVITPQVPTKIDNQTITVDIQVTDNREIDFNDVQVSLVNTTAGIANFMCTQTSSTQVDCSLQVLSSGDIEIRAEDARGLTSTELDTNYIVDTESPLIVAGLDTSAPFSTSSPEVTFSATDNVSAAVDIDFTVSVDDGPFVAQTSPYTPTLVGDRHIIVIRAADELGNESEYTFVYTPLLTITAPTTTSNADIADTTIIASSVNDLTDVTITGAGSTFVCSPDPTLAVPSSGPVTCTGVVTSTGTLNISATDTLVTDLADIAYVIEQTPPVVNITAPTTSGTDGITDTSIQVTDDVAINADDVFIDGSSSAAARLFNCTQTSSTQVDCTIDVASSGDLIIFARDRSGNEATSSQSYTVIPAGFSKGGGGGSNSLMLCTSDPKAANYYAGDLDIDAFRFYKIVKRCLYGNEPVTPIAETPLVEVAYEKPQCFINYSRLIKRGLRGNDVKQVQRCMNSLGYTSGPEDGIYGPLTYAGITAYQRAHGLKYVDGIVGPETSTSLNKLGYTS